MCTGDGLPAQVCQQCVQQVNICYNFKIQCERSDANLRHYLQNLKRQELLTQVGKILSILTLSNKISNMKVILHQIYQHTILTACIHVTLQLVTLPDVFLLKFFMRFLPLTPRLCVPAHNLLGFAAISVVMADKCQIM